MANFKVVDSDILDAKFTSIADAIRSKTGKTELIPDDELAAEIENITGGGEYDIEEVVNDDGTRTLHITDASGGGKPDGSGIVSTVMLGTDFYIYSQISELSSSLEVEENA